MMYMEERDYLKKNSLAKSRKLVIYRQMITSNKKALDTLKRLHRYDHEIHHMPEDFQEAIQQQLDSAINYHEQMTLKYIGKIKSEVSITEEQTSLNKKELYQLFLAHQKKLAETDSHLLYHMMQLVSVIMEYGEQLEHLDTLITSYQAYHKEDKQLLVESTLED